MDSKNIMNDLKKNKVTYNPFIAGLLSKAVPTTEAQREIWASIVMDENATLCYNESVAIELEGQLQPDVLSNALQQVLKRHDSLRAVFSGDGKFFFVKEFSEAPVVYLDYSNRPIGEIDQLKKSEVEFKYDLQNGPCYRAILVKTGKNKYSFLLSAHHIICDGWSIAVLLSELSEFYEAILNQKKIKEDEVYQFADFAINEFKDGIDQDHKKYWLQEFSSPLVTNPFPVDLKRPGFRTFNSTRYDVAVSKELVRDLKRLGAAQGCSFYSTLVSAFNIFLYQLTKSQDIVVGMASAAQAGLGQNDLVGHLVSILPLRTTIKEDMPLHVFMKYVKSKMLDAFDHQFYSYGSLVKDLKNLPRDPSQMPLLNVVFNIDQQPLDQGLKFKGINASYVTLPRDYENFEIFINAVSRGDELILECQYNTNLFTAATLENWISTFLELLSMLTREPQKTIKSFELPYLKIPVPSVPEKQKSSQPVVRNPEVEDKIKAIWSQVLLNHSLEIEDNFFRIGGHSLLAIEVANLMTEEFGMAFSIKDIFENPTILELSSKITEGKTEKTLLPPLVASGVTSTQVSHNQMQIWYLEEMNPNTYMHNLPGSIRIRAHVDHAAMEKTIHFLMERHASLRTAIVVEDGIPVQKILDKNLPQFHRPLELINSNENEVMSLLKKDAVFCFDKTNPPLFKAKLYKFSENDYLLFYMFHHAVWDGWSFDIFFEELNIMYTSFVENKTPVFSKNPQINYVEYTSWLHSLIRDKILDKQIEYWKEKLKTPLPILELPADHKRPLEMTHIGETFYFTLSEERSKILRNLSRTTETSLFNIFLTAFKVTLARYTGLDDIIVGLPVRGRNFPEIMQTTGYFVNTLALRTEINLNQSFEENLKRVTTTCLEAFDNQLIPFQIILNQVNYPRDLSRTPIFQTLLSYQDVNHREMELNGTPFLQMSVDKASTHTDLDVWVRVSDKKIMGGFEYRTDLFDKISIERLAESFFTVLDGLAENVQRPLNITRAIPVSHEEMIIKEWNDTQTKKDDFVAFHKIFEENANKFPEMVAIETGQDSITYGELNKIANRCANALLEKSVGRGDLVGISLTRNSNLIATILGVLKTGAGYVPLDPGFPQDRLDYMIESANPKILLTENSLVSRFDKCQAEKLMALDIVHDARFDKVLPDIHNELSDTIYVIYTSGSTGNPKGVQLTHGSVTNFLLSMQDKIKTKQSDKILAVTTLSFDIAVLELFLPLISGSGIYLASSAEAMDGASLKKILETKNISIMQATPSTWRLLLTSGWKGSSSIKILCGGEAFPIDLAKKLIPICKEVWNMYGPTETTVWSSCKKLSLEDECITIGRPIDNTYLYILDENRFMQPIGVTGELFIGGYGLAKGYFGREDLTTERFMPDPFIPGGRMYATGDLARFKSNGEVECLGRNDGQVKVRGYRIELGEIEAELQRVPGVKVAAVITSEYRPGDVRILAYLSTGNGVAIEERVLRETLSKKLPTYMIPSHFTHMKEIPTTLNGKIDKKSLPKIQAPSSGETKNEEALQVPVVKENKEDSVREILRSIWIELLGVRELKDSDNFFNVGGNSLLAVQLFSKISNVFKISLPLATLIEAEDFKAFAINLEQKLNPEKNSGNPENDRTGTQKSISVVPQIFKSMVAIKSTGDSNPFFCFHGVGGNILNYVTLVPATKNERPLLALQSVGMDGITPPLVSIEEMAKSYIREIKAVQPEGPYLLGGGSMGGMIAFEAAIQLIKSGEKIDKLIMFDTFGPNLDLRSYTKERGKPFLVRLKRAFFIRGRNLFNKFQTYFYRELGLHVPLPVLLREIERKNYQAIWKYFPTEPFAGDLHLVRSKIESTGWYSDPAMGWKGNISGEIKTYEINGTHENFIESQELITVLKNII